MILHESTETHHRKIYVRIPERLPKLVRIPREKIRERTEVIYTIEAVQYVGSQADAIHSSAPLPKVFASRASVRVVGLIMIFATVAVACVGPPEDDQSCDVNFRAEWFVRAQDGMSRGGLQAQITNSL